MIPYRSLHPNRKPRKVTECFCHWCFENYLAERSDSKYCCDSHKSLACNKRTNEKWKQQRISEEATQELRRKQREREKIASQPANQKPTPIKQTQNIFQETDFVKLQNEITAMFDKSIQDQKIRDKKYEFESQSRLFTQLPIRLLECSSNGYINRFDIDRLLKKVDEIICNDAICQQDAFNLHLEFIENQLFPFLEELDEQESQYKLRRLKLELPPEIFSGLQLLRQPITFKQDLVPKL
ncbi:hypothetical protein BH11BAC7_BH11BAC7_26300 [soil metagenome]